MRWPRRRPPAPLSFEFQPRSRPAAAGWLLFVVSCVFAADVAWSYIDIQDRSHGVMQQLAALPAAPQRETHRQPAYSPKDIDREAAFARAVITKIGLPWSQLFKALNATQVEDVQLLGVEPDPVARTVRITAEAQDIPAMLTYVARLESEQYFKSVGLLQHEVKRDSRRGIVSFVVAVAWKQK